MLSIALPVYNFTVTGLVRTLLDQAKKSGVPFEIIIMDDASQPEFKAQNRTLTQEPDVLYTELDKNTGRSVIRNRLAQRARYDNILFLDCDSDVRDDDFIHRYIERSKTSAVIYGGRKFDMMRPARAAYMLHWLYSTKTEWVDVHIREANPIRYFKTNNFLIKKGLFSRIRFNEELKEYGHEDTLFGYELSRKNIVTDHIDNPVYHIGMKETGEFLKNTREGFINLKRLLEADAFDTEGLCLLGLSNLDLRNRKRIFAKGMTVFYNLLEKAMLKNLYGKKPSLFVFKLYKLGYFCSLH